MKVLLPDPSSSLVWAREKQRRIPPISMLMCVLNSVYFDFLDIGHEGGLTFLATSANRTLF